MHAPPGSVQIPQLSLQHSRPAPQVTGPQGLPEEVPQSACAFSQALWSWYRSPQSAPLQEQPPSPTQLFPSQA